MDLADRQALGQASDRPTASVLGNCGTMEPVESDKPPAAPTPGWYPDPVEPDIQRYWDGQQWIDPTPPAPTPAPPPEPAAATPPYAPLSWRLGARAVDLVALLLLNAAVNGWFIYQYLQEIGPVVARAGRGESSAFDIEISDRAERLSLLIIAVSLLLWLAYEVPAIASSGQTLGKRILGLKVVSVATLQTPSVGQALRRWFPPAIPMLLGPLCAAPFLIMIAISVLVNRPAHRGVYDTFANTVVVVVPAPGKKQ